MKVSSQVETIYLWPESVPSSTKPKSDIVMSSNKERYVSRVAEVTNPKLEVYHPSTEKANGQAIIICPGGGYNILAIDLEGHEIAEWLSSLGYTACVLYYRVPQNREGALQDAQRAMRIVRSKSKAWKLNEDKIGIMGFSAGGHLSAMLSSAYQTEHYKAIDKIDEFSAKPNFTALIYPAYLDAGLNKTLSPELMLSESMPPVFIFETADDPHGNSALVMATALRDANLPIELHFLAAGGHGYGLRKGKDAAETWPRLLEKWLLAVSN